MDNQQPSTSSSSSGQQREMAKIEEEQVEKKIKEESKSHGENQVQVEVESNCFIDELPPEMLMKILGCLDVKSIALSRLVNRRWNGIARQTIKSRDDVETVFYPYAKRSGSGKMSILGKTLRGGLKSFMKHFDDSKESLLYTRFRFDGIQPSVFECEDWIKFISDFGQSVKCLKLVVKRNLEDPAELMQLADKLRLLFLNQLPGLEEFGLHFSSGAGDILTKAIQLFPTTTAQLQLPHLKVLCINENFLSNYAGIFTDLLGAAINLQKIESFHKDRRYELAETFHLLQSLGKLQYLQEAQICLDAQFMTKLKNLQEKSTAPLEFKLRTLELNTNMSSQDPASWSIFFSNLLQSSKDTLEDLTLGGSGFLPQLQLPKFSKLTSLYINCRIQPTDDEALPSGLNLTEIFPILQSLKIEAPWTAVFPHDDDDENDSYIPNLKTLVVKAHNSTKEDIIRISQACPNLEKFEIHSGFFRGLIKNFPQVGTAIWTHMKQLELLDLKIFVHDPAITFPDINSCFTGFSRDYCERLDKELRQAENSAKTLESQIKISKSDLKKERKNPSILDLKDLRNLKVCLWSDRRPTVFNPFLPKKTLIVSEKYDFQLMENLTYKIEENF